MVRQIACAALLCGLVQPGWSQDAHGQKTSLDLDGKSPMEILQEWDGGKRVLFWSAPDKTWIEVFHAKQFTGLVDDERSFFKRIVADGRQWQWRNEGFVPLVAEVAVPAEQTSEADFQAASAVFAADLAELPANGAGNFTFLHQTGAGEGIKVVQLATTTICAAGGSECPLVVLRPQQPPKAYFVRLDSAWGLSDQGGKVYLEYQLDNAVARIDLDTGAEVEISLVAPRAAPSPPSHPRHAD